MTFYKKWNANSISHYCAGEEGGIIFIYDQANSTEDYAGQVFSISSFSQFTAVYSEVEMHQLKYGLPITVNSTAAGYRVQTVISYSNKGFYQGVQKWGKELLDEHGKTTVRRETDNTVNYLGYWTDRGAFYYYNTEPNKTYEETMLDVYAKVEEPYKSWNYDSWFYPKCEWGGQTSHEWPVKNWTSMAEIFPNGMNNLFQVTGLLRSTASTSMTLSTLLDRKRFNYKQNQ